MNTSKLFSLGLAIGLYLLPLCSQANTSASLTTRSEAEINYAVYPANGKQLLLWFYSEAGPQQSDRLLAQAISKLGVEVWLIDLFDSYFLPVAGSSMDKIPAQDISELISMAQQKTTKKVFALTNGRAVIPLLRAARELQISQPDTKDLAGLVLISPKFFTETPEPGQQPQLMPVVDNTNQLLFVIQPANSPWFWKLGTTIPALEKSGSDVFLQKLKNVRDRFYFRPDADTVEQQMTERLPAIILNALTALDKYPAKSRQASTSAIVIPQAIANKKDKLLKPHKGNIIPPALDLLTVTDQRINLHAIKNKVVLVNFWASWCPPCVHEMPSMQRLQDTFTDEQFVILGVNMAEDKATINKFLQHKVSVSFPLLMDSDGSALQRWQVFAFPTSYLIDKKGQIRYSLFGSIEWDTKEIKSIIEQLISE